MSNLDRKFVENCLPLKEGFKPYKEPLRRMSIEVTFKVKDDVERLINVGLVRISRYVEW